ILAKPVRFNRRKNRMPPPKKQTIDSKKLKKFLPQEQILRNVSVLLHFLRNVLVEFPAKGGR
ncbi:MAG: hypothetical protein QCI00_07570, partial [Candidatus Thermoplasmatota archaeon]|nr:hypothetical protein [Candidatus Thermoplasmatota archaeon]